MYGSKLKVNKTSFSKKSVFGECDFAYFRDLQHTNLQSKKKTL